MSIDALSIQVAQISAEPGASSIGISIAVDNAVGIAGGEFTLGYDTSTFTVKQVEAASTVKDAGIVLISNLKTEGQVKISLAGATGISSGSGVLFTIFFDIKSNASPAVYALELSRAVLRNDLGVALPISNIASGSIEVIDDTPATPGEVKLTVGNAVAKPGEAGIMIQVVVDDAMGIAGGEFIFDYDLTVLDAKLVTSADLLSNSGIILISNLNTSGRIKVSLAGASGIAFGSGSLFHIVFDVKPDASSETYPVELTDAVLRDEVGKSIEIANLISGFIKIEHNGIPSPNGLEPISLAVEGGSSPAGARGFGVGIIVDEATGIAGGEFTLSYDESTLSAAQVDIMPLLSAAGITLVSNLNTPGQVKISLAGASGIASGRGMLFQVIFDIQSNALPATYPLELTEAVLRGEQGQSLDLQTITHGSLIVTQGNAAPHPDPLGIDLKVGDISGMIGDTGIVVEITADNIGQIAGGKLNLAYNSEVLIAKRVTSDLLSSGGIAVVPNLTTLGIVKVSLAGAAVPLDNGAALLAIAFDIQSDALPGIYALELTDVVLRDESGRPLLLQNIVSGAIEISAPNASPVLSRTISDAEFEVGQAASALDLNSQPPIFVDTDGDDLFFIANSSAPTIAAVEIISGSVVIVTPLSAGNAQITVSAEDGKGGKVSAVFWVAVRTPTAFPNRAPEAVNDTVRIVPNNGENMSRVNINVLRNDIDLDNNVLSIIDYSRQTEHSENIVLNSNNTIHYRPVVGFVGTDSITYVVSDSVAQDTAVVIIQVINGIPLFETSLGSIRELSWGTIARSETPERIDFKVLNKGEATLNVSNLRINGTLLMKLITEPRFEVSAGGETVVVLELTPSVTGKIEATLTLTTDDPNNPSVSLDLTADVRSGKPKIFNLDDLSFDSAALGVTSIDDVTVQNKGGLADLKIFDVESDNPQVDITAFSTNPIPSDDTSLIQASYTPRAFQARSGVIYVYSNAEENPKKILWSATEVQVDTLSLMGTLPANGETNAGVNTVALDFSADVLNLGSRFAPVIVDLYPEPLNTDWQNNVLVDGGRVIYQNVQLEPGRSYRLSVLAATGSRGQELGTTQVILFSTGGNLVPTGTISGTVVLTSRTTFEDSRGQIQTRVDTLNTQGGRVFAVDILTKAIVAEQVLDGRGRFELSRLHVRSDVSDGSYFLYAEVEGREQTLNVGFDEADDGNLDQIELFPGRSLTPVTFIIEDVFLQSGVTPGRVLVDAHEFRGNQNDISAAYLDSTGTLSIALYAEGVMEMKAFEVDVTFDTSQLDFIDFTGSSTESFSAGLRGDVPLFAGQKDGVSIFRTMSLEDQEQSQVLRLIGKLLDARIENSVSGNGLLGVIKFAPKSVTAKKTLSLSEQSMGQPVVKIGPLVLQSTGQLPNKLDGVEIKIILTQREDFNGDGDVGFGDFLAFARQFGSESISDALARLDLNGDKKIDFADFLILANKLSGQ